MSTSYIPFADGVPGISGPPDWLSANSNYQLDDVRWNGATQRSFGSGGSPDAVFRALVDHSSQYVYVSLWARFVPLVSDENDLVYIGLQTNLATGVEAIVFQLQVHHNPTGFPAPNDSHNDTDPAGTAPGNPPFYIGSVQYNTYAGGAWGPAQTFPSTSNWVHDNARVWNHPPDGTDNNYRWAIQLRIPVSSTATHVTDPTGLPFKAPVRLWYFIQGSHVSSGGSSTDAIKLAEWPSLGTSVTDISLGAYPPPTNWGDPVVLGSPPDSTGGGVAIVGNGAEDIFVWNGPPPTAGTALSFGGVNKFVARPRNYTGTPILAGQIAATFRMANWGSIMHDPSQTDFTSGPWDYVPGSDPLNPLASVSDIPNIAAGPPNTAPTAVVPEPLELDATFDAAKIAGKSLHQCILVSLTGVPGHLPANTTLFFLNDSAYRNMDFDHTSMVERYSEINATGLKAPTGAALNVRIAVEKINMPDVTPPGTDEGQFLAQTTARLIDAGGPLAAKLKVTRKFLAKAGDCGSAKALTGLEKLLGESLAGMKSTDPRRGRAAIKGVLDSARPVLAQIKGSPAAVSDVALLLNRMANLLLADESQRRVVLADVGTSLATWRNLVRADRKLLTLTQTLVRALLAWSATLAEGGLVTQFIEQVGSFLGAARVSTAQVASLQKFLGDSARATTKATANLTTWFAASSRWVKGQERLDCFVGALNRAGVTEAERDRIFPSIRYHVYYDSGERKLGRDGKQHPVWLVQPSFGVYAYPEGPVTGWQSVMPGALRIAGNVYQMQVPAQSRARQKHQILSLGRNDKPGQDDPIKRVPGR